MRKVVISTNLAETSITIDDCVFVVDAGRMKEKRFDPVKNMESLDTVSERKGGKFKLAFLNMFILVYFSLCEGYMCVIECLLELFKDHFFSDCLLTFPQLHLPLSALAQMAEVRQLEDLHGLYL